MFVLRICLHVFITIKEPKTPTMSLSVLHLIISHNYQFIKKIIIFSFSFPLNSLKVHYHTFIYLLSEILYLILYNILLDDVWSFDDKFYFLNLNITYKLSLILKSRFHHLNGTKRKKYTLVLFSAEYVVIWKSVP